ncbi:MAG: OmpA family protein [Endozoicomonas sp.]
MVGLAFLALTLSLMFMPLSGLWATTLVESDRTSALPESSEKRHTRTFPHGLGETLWTLEASRFICRLSNTIPGLGRFDLTAQAGGDERVTLQPDPLYDQDRHVVFSLGPPAWKSDAPSTVLKEQYFASGKRLSIAFNISSLVESMQQGKELVFDVRRKPDPDFRLRVPSIQIQKTAGDFFLCQDQLLVMNFQQARQNHFYYLSKQKVLNDRQKARLANIANYLMADNTVIKMTIDSHTDSIGSDLINRKISEQRARNIHGFLLGLGVPAEKLLMRFHGERYPVASNRSEAGRDKNRRVEIQLLK